MMYRDINLHSDIEIIKKTFPQLRDDCRQLDYYNDRHEAFDWEGLLPLGSDTVQTSLF
ncbi:hypothetical protein [Sphingobacterium sp. DR205]|uniref:hypothetical protein n=1 Tax=Sphingobacterium sp. DR205 TaxID=2713573 RepID=UPI0013E41CF9|nr:hypothetical protein [Sphingobacterium sp. DR205]QIH34832.1 hypothetical protein G6053_18875 [Sphingobacterium sp. DR205]